ncbi:MAG: isopeptide-forming domain-containing fimbrial protein [Lachnospiraceae bacterium]|nr:isopeptide-forming domain-containing fimbrial protein [Lachnospiraceae bacterium]
MKRIKKILAFCMAVILSMSLMLTVSANGDVTDGGEGDAPVQEDGYTVTIKDANDGHTYEAYQIFAGDYANGILSSIKWGTGFNKDQAKAFLDELKQDTVIGSYFAGINAEGKTADQLASDIAKVLELEPWRQPDNHNIRRFAEILHGQNTDKTYKYLSTNCKQSEREDNAYKIEDLDSGYYLIKDKDGSVVGNDYYTRLLMQVVGNQEISPKGDVPTVEKKVHTLTTGTFLENEDVALTDPFYFKLTGTFPSNYEDYKSYEYEFVDTMSKGIELKDAGWKSIVSITVERANGGMVELYLTNDQTKADDPTVTEAGQEYHATQMITNNAGVEIYRKYNLLVATSEDEIREQTKPDGTILTDVLVTYEDKIEDGQVTGRILKIKFLDLKTSLPGIIHTDKIVVKYEAKLNQDAIITNWNNKDDSDNINEVVLNFSNNPQGDGTGQTPKDDAKVYSYELDVLKVDDEKNPLSGAEFLLYQKVGSGNDMINQQYAYAILETISEGHYRIKNWIVLNEIIYEEVNGVDEYLDKDGNESTNKNCNFALDSTLKVLLCKDGEGLNVAGEIVSESPEGICMDSLIMKSSSEADNKGKIIIEGLDATTYFLQELNAPDMYNKLTDPVSATINVNNDDKKGEHTYLGVTKGSGDPGEIITIQNFKGAVLPSTGGIGTTIFYVVGGILVAAALVLLVTKKRMSDRA